MRRYIIYPGKVDAVEVDENRNPIQRPKSKGPKTFDKRTKQRKGAQHGKNHRAD